MLMTEPTERDLEVADGITRVLDTWEPESGTEALQAIAAYREECAKAERERVLAEMAAVRRTPDGYIDAEHLDAVIAKLRT